MSKYSLWECVGRPLAGLAVGLVVLGCGGGASAPENYGPPREITITEIALSEATPVALAGSPVYFEGGVCSGGNGPLRAKWSYDSTDGPAGVYTFPIPVAPKVMETHVVRVKCTDASGVDFKWALDTLDVNVYAPGTTPP